MSRVSRPARKVMPNELPDDYTHHSRLRFECVLNAADLLDILSKYLIVRMKGNVHIYNISRSDLDLLKNINRIKIIPMAIR